MVSRSPYIAVVVYESTSDSPGYEPMYQEDFVLLYAGSEDEARKLAHEAAVAQETTYENERGELIKVSLKHVVDVNQSLTDDLSKGGDLYSRHFRDYESYRRIESLLGDAEL
ncbi:MULTISPECIES: DUF4288 domain-containing protein [Nocardia]|uniref:DUF4288 domain-containing protein n=1 Tax=Nocardia arthritidis TaxID=228602 RepID=A0A6G9Y752_9NOCA|nr:MULTISPECIES: DUF4288 domain-containing protein [Nocardia]QIS09042.1 DUF4288 domain-containing protein [Nocardia arthritidis]